MTRRGAYAKGIVKREEILTTALEVVAANGYRRASVRELADAVGLSAAGLLHYFDSKEELFTAILRKRDEHDREAYGTDGADLSRFLTVIRHNATVPGLVQLYAQLAVEAVDPEHPAHAFFRERTRALQDHFRAAVIRAQENDEIRADLDPAWVATSVQALSDGLQSLWLVDPDVDMAVHIERFLDALRPASHPQGGAAS
ncbi:TetR/AcrR family transcriptional regulator [Microbacterium sp. NPDC056234]|uniref:TetR/AcrR family transcriptional regulator n=1 Tax=Microbacterium sp. NPDC056234 TaxID=3345757 RepID=UPI0035DB6B06